MYLKNLLIINSGALGDLEIEFQFNPDGLPMPTILVGKNGAGKTNVLSFVADGMIETAASHFFDIMPTASDGRQYFRVVGGKSIRNGAAYEVAMLRFEDSEPVLYRSKGGQVDFSAIESRLAKFPGFSPWAEKGNIKDCIATPALVEKIFQTGCYAYFPSSRAEQPYWARQSEPTTDASIFQDRYTNRLGKPLVINSSIDDLKPWIVDVILDQAIDALDIALNPQAAPAKMGQALHNNAALQNLNRIIQLVTGIPDARVVRAGRQSGERKIQIMSGADVAFSSLNALSAGQATLLSIFATILRYADSGAAITPPNEMTGIVVVDEIDAHLHADLQHEVLPKLIKMFPKIQFIVSSHAPLLPLGMEAAFGSDGICMLELPSGTRITAERFGEFLGSFKYFQATKAFEASVSDTVAKAQRPLVICEGQTDPEYMKTAAELLGFDELRSAVDFDWIGKSGPAGAQDGGKDRLAQAAKLLKNNPGLVRTHTALIFDCDSQKPSEDEGNLHIRAFPLNEENSVCKSGIENLLPDVLFEERFYEQTERRTADITIIRKLKKEELRKWVCEERKDLGDFEKFRPVLEELNKVLF